MKAQVATIVYLLGILGLFALDRRSRAGTSRALWIPVAWLAIASSRMLGEWLAIWGLTSGEASGTSADRLLDGSPLDRMLLTGLLALALFVLVRRGQRLRKLLQGNVPILLFLLYCGVSTLWSDYTEVSFKRWIKALGDMAMVLIVLTDAHPITAVKR